MEIILHGAAGRMGKMVEQLAGTDFMDAHIFARVDALGGDGIYKSLTEIPPGGDVLVDFSHHACTQNLTDWVQVRNMPLVIATTGQTMEETAQIQAAAKHIPIFFAPNYSMGIALLTDLARRAALTFPEAEVEIVETHHDQKLDVPSGTAKLLAQTIADTRTDAPIVVGRHTDGKRNPKEIGVHSLRLGREVGTHQIILTTGTETITLTHQAHSRESFAQGALRAAAFLLGKPAGLYNMRDLLE